MPRRQNSFARALSDATKRLEKAQAERAYAQTKLGQLSNEIPALERTIAALYQQITPDRSQVGMMHERLAAKPPANMNPEELAKWYTERDLSSAGSIPPGGDKPAVQQLSEDELLPDELPGRSILEK